jgi:hypothetical protein
MNLKQRNERGVELSSMTRLLTVQSRNVASMDPQSRNL